MENQLDVSAFKQLHVKVAKRFQGLPTDDWRTEGLPEIAENVVTCYLRSIKATQRIFVQEFASIVVDTYIHSIEHNHVSSKQVIVRAM